MKPFLIFRIIHKLGAVAKNKSKLDLLKSTLHDPERSNNAPTKS